MLPSRSFAALTTVLMLLAIGGALPGCAGEKDAAFSHAIRQSTPPRDFALSLTVQGPSAGVGTRSIITPGRDGRPGYTVSYPVLNTGSVDTRTLPLALRPARYVIEPDWVLRTGVGAGSRETYYPFQTRQLNAAQVDRLWSALVKSGLLAPDHEAVVSRTPTDEESGDKTLYILSYTVAGVRRTLVLPATAVPPGVEQAEAASAAPEGETPTVGALEASDSTNAAASIGPAQRPAPSPVEGVLGVFAELSWMKDQPPVKNSVENEVSK